MPAKKPTKTEKKVAEAFHEVHANVPSTVKATGTTGAAKEKMLTAVAAEGSSEPENLQLLCHGCNRGKWTMSVENYIAHCIKVADFARKAREAGADIPAKPAKTRGSRAGY